MPRNHDIQKVLVIGSGPIIIGQAAEFDYAGTQACRALKEEGIEVVLINSNPATIMTDKDIADKVYIEPLTVPVVKHLIEVEKPDSILPTLGGQIGLNLAIALAKTGILEELGIKLLGTQLDAIDQAEDRQRFKDLMQELNEPVPDSKTVETVQEALDFAAEIGYPVIVRPAFTMGGTGGGLCDNPEQLKNIKDFGHYGMGLMIFLSYGTISDIDDRQQLASLAYLFISKAIKQNSANANLFKNRLLLMITNHEAFEYTVSSVVNKDQNFFSMNLIVAQNVTFHIQISNVPLSKLRRKPKVIGKHIFLNSNPWTKLIKAPQSKFKM